MDNEIRQGRLANRSGNTLEKTVVGTLTSIGFEFVKYRDYLKKKELYGKELLLYNVPFTTIYNHQGNTEFLLLSEKYRLEIRIECKWQQSSGSVDEKYPYLYLNCIEAMPEKNIIILIDGGGAKIGALEWLKYAAQNKLYTTEQNKDKNVMVMNLSEFLIWVNKIFR